MHFGMVGPPPLRSPALAPGASVWGAPHTVLAYGAREDQGRASGHTTLSIASSKFEEVWRRVNVTLAHGFWSLCFA